MLDGRWSLDSATANDAGDIVQLLRASLPGHLRALTIWASPRATCYIQDVLSGAISCEAHRFYVLRHRSKAAGLAVFRLVEDAAFLNHLYVAPWCRGRSLGSLLLGWAASCYLALHPAERVVLDVWAGNRRAEAWYGRLGFVKSGACGWWVTAGGPAEGSRTAPRRPVSLDAADAPVFSGSARHSGSPDAAGQAVPPEATPCSVSAGAAAARQHRAWGFSQFVAKTGSGRYDVGRLSTPWFRLADPRAATDTALHAHLRALDPTRGILLLAASLPPMPRSSIIWKQVAESRRLTCDSALLLGRLAARGRGRRVLEAEPAGMEPLL